MNSAVSDLDRMGKLADTHHQKDNWEFRFHIFVNDTVLVTDLEDKLYMIWNLSLIECAKGKDLKFLPAKSKVTKTSAKLKDEEIQFELENIMVGGVSLAETTFFRYLGSSEGWKRLIIELWKVKDC